MTPAARFDRSVRHSLRVLLVPLASCAHSQAAPPAAPAAPAPEAVSSAPISRQLAAEARYSDLVRTANLLDGSEVTTSCLLARAEGGFRLAGELRGGLRPLPMPADELDEALKAAGAVQVLTPWGRYGEPSAPLALASVSAFTPAPRALALLLTDRGVSVRGITGPAQASLLAGGPEGLAALGSLEGVAVFVAAEAQVPVDQLYALMEELTRLGANAVLAVDLTSVSALPAPAPAAQPARCPDGLAETSAPAGDLSQDALLAGLSPLRERVADCLTQGGAAGAAGGRLTLGMRIDERGGVVDACLVADQLGDDGVLSCVLGLARGLRFEAPAPAGVVDVELPLVLRPHSAPAQVPVCADTDS